MFQRLKYLLLTNRGRMWLVFIATLILLFAASYSVFQVTKLSVIEDAKHDSLIHAQAIDRDVRSLLSEARSILHILSLSTELQSESCKTILNNTLNSSSINSRFGGIALVSDSKQVVCSTYSDSEGKDLSSLNLFNLEAEIGQLNVGRLRNGELSGSQVIPLAIKFVNKQGTPYFLALAIKVESLFSILQQQPMDEYSAAFIIDHNGMIIASRHPKGAKYWQGRSVLKSPLYQQVHSENIGARVGRGLDNITRVYAFKEASLDGTHLHIVATQERQALLFDFFGKLGGPIFVSLFSMLIFLVLMTAIVYLFYYRSIQALVGYAIDISQDLSWENENTPESSPFTSNILEVENAIFQLKHAKSLLEKRTTELRFTQEVAGIISWTFEYSSNEFLLSGPFKLVLPELDINLNSLDDLSKYLSYPEKKNFSKALNELFNKHAVLSIVLPCQVPAKGGPIIHQIKVYGEFIQRADIEKPKFIGFIQNLTSYISVTKKLERTEYFLKALLDNLESSVIACNANGVIEVFNSTSEKIYQKSYSAIHVTELPSYYSIHDSSGENLLKPNEFQLHRALLGEYISDELVTVKPKGLNPKNLLVQGQPILNRQGEKVGAVIIQTDITLKMVRELEFKKQEEQLRTVFNSSFDGLILCTTSGSIIRANDALARLIGKDRKINVGDNIRNLFREKEWHSLLNNMVSVADKNAQTSEVSLFSNEKVDMTIEVRCAKLQNEKENLLLFVIRDISQRKQAEEKNISIQRIEAVSQLTGGIAHDFNNLLQVIFMNLDLLECELEGNKAVIPFIEACLKAATRGGVLTKHLLSFTKQRSMYLKAVELNSLLSEISEFFLALFDKKHKIELRLCDEPVLIETDEAQFKMALTHLVINASESLNGSGTIQIGILKENNVDKTVSECLIFVSDNGQGMSGDTVKRAIEPFFTTKKIGQGSGLGLSMVYGFVKQCSGDLKIESNLGEGTRITMTFPLLPSTN